METSLYNMLCYTCLHFLSSFCEVVWIGDNVKIGRRCIIKDNCIIESGVTLGDDTVIPPFTRISVKNPTVYQELPPSVAVQMQEISLDRYSDFKQEQRDKQ
jgi:tetrahydrodipicolinate N-succinyltransferase